MALNTYRRLVLTGGSEEALDGIDGATLADNDIAIVATTLGYFYLYYLDASSGAAESSPSVIAPDTNAGTKCWILAEIFYAKLVSTNGIKFPATQIASSDANTLDDYEETGGTAVTLTCGTSGTITLDSAVNKISTTKIGRMVFVSGILNIDSVSSPVGTLTLNGLPYTVKNTNEAYAAGSVVMTPTTAISGVTGYVITSIINTTTARISGITTTGVVHAAPALNAASQIWLSLAYMV